MGKETGERLAQITRRLLRAGREADVTWLTGIAENLAERRLRPYPRELLPRTSTDNGSLIGEKAEPRTPHLPKGRPDLPRPKLKDLQPWIFTGIDHVVSSKTQMEEDASFMDGIPGSRKLHIPKGELIYREEDIANRLLLLRKGRAFTFTYGERRKGQSKREDGLPSTERAIMQWHDAPSVIGEAVFLDSRRHPSSARALTDCTVIAVENSKTLRDNPDTMVKVMELVARRIRKQRNHAEDIVHFDIDTGVAITLLNLLDTDSAVNEQDLADTLGSSRESVSKTCSRLKETGVLEHGGVLRIKDRRGLIEIALRMPPAEIGANGLR